MTSVIIFCYKAQGAHSTGHISLKEPSKTSLARVRPARAFHWADPSRIILGIIDMKPRLNLPGDRLQENLPAAIMADTETVTSFLPNRWCPLLTHCQLEDVQSEDRKPSLSAPSVQAKQATLYHPAVIVTGQSLHPTHNNANIFMKSLSRHRQLLLFFVVQPNTSLCITSRGAVLQMCATQPAP